MAVTWGKPADYVYLIKATGVPAYERRLLVWLADQGYPQMEALRKELARGDKKGSADSSGSEGQETRPGKRDGALDGDW
jgi:hypothetical protein